MGMGAWLWLLLVWFGGGEILSGLDSTAPLVYRVVVPQRAPIPGCREEILSTSTCAIKVASHRSVSTAQLGVV
uniref:Uncharacterized protein n=1 Tax=Setaria viridis TaxID=4556 RepID=A0A4V6D781_SETVI|nr:hypothetical protein SEVIR_5G352832v2 [Setaria viridis]